jgi:hypothetical protein
MVLIRLTLKSTDTMNNINYKASIIGILIKVALN